MRDPHVPRHGRCAASGTWLAGAGGLLALALMATGVPLPSSPLRPGRIWRLPPPDLARRAADAQRTMTAAEDRVRADKRRAGVRTEAEAEPDPSGLLGNELTPLVTTLGSLEAKRLATNPLWARVLTERLAGVGIGRGDVVAASFSGSFPGLNLAVMAACQALGADLTAVSSTTASTWGANQPGFTWPEIEARLVGAGLVARASWAVTAGGEADGALDLPVEGRTAARAAMQAAARRLGVPALEPRDFDDAVRQRIALYRRAANGRPVALYVNVGGASASLGRSPAILRQRSGFLPGGPFDLSPGRGVTARFAEQGVRVLMLLNVRDLALRWGVPLSGRRR